MRDETTDPEIRARELKADLEKFFKRCKLTDFAWFEGSQLSEDQKAHGGEKTYFRMGFDGEIYQMFWAIDGDPRDLARSRSRRATFDGIVKKHGFWTEFEEYYRICFMLIPE